MDKVEVGDRILIPAEVATTYWGGKFFIAKTRHGAEIRLHAANADPAPADVNINKANVYEVAEISG
jgi:hypothetical protein